MVSVALGWVGAPDSIALKSLRETGARISNFDTLDDALARRGDMRGICVDTGVREVAFRSAERNDGLAGAVGWCDTLAFAGGLPGAFGFCCRVGGLVQAIREQLGQMYVRIPAVIVGGGSEAAAAMAAFTQLKATALTLYAPKRDALVLAVSHRMGLDIASRPYEDLLSSNSAGQRWRSENSLLEKDRVCAEDTRMGEGDAHGESCFIPREAEDVLLSAFPAEITGENKALLMDAATGMWGLTSVDRGDDRMKFLLRDTALSWRYTAEAQIRLLA